LYHRDSIIRRKIVPVALKHIPISLVGSRSISARLMADADANEVVVMFLNGHDTKSQLQETLSLVVETAINGIKASAERGEEAVDKTNDKAE
jgi:hypothetical protein